EAWGHLGVVLCRGSNDDAQPFPSLAPRLALLGEGVGGFAPRLTSCERKPAGPGEDWQWSGRSLTFWRRTRPRALSPFLVPPSCRTRQQGGTLCPRRRTGVGRRAPERAPGALNRGRACSLVASPTDAPSQPHPAPRGGEVGQGSRRKVPCAVPARGYSPR